MGEPGPLRVRADRRPRPRRGPGADRAGEGVRVVAARAPRRGPGRLRRQDPDQRQPRPLPQAAGRGEQRRGADRAGRRRRHRRRRRARGAHGGADGAAAEAARGGGAALLGRPDGDAGGRGPRLLGRKCEEPGVAGPGEASGQRPASGRECDIVSDAEPAGLTGGADGDGDGMFADIGHFETGAIPVDAVVKRGKAIRNRRRLVGGGALAAATALTIAVPVALAGGSGEGAKPTAGHAIVVERPYENAAQQIAFAGSIDGKAWSRTYVSHCSGKPPLGGAECLVRVPGADKSPVEMVMQDEWHKQGDFYSAQFGPDTDYVVITLDTGDQATVPGVAADDGYRVAYFELPRRSTIEKITAYRKDGREIAHTRPGTIMGVENVLRMALVWDRPDDGELDNSIQTVHVQSGTNFVLSL